MNNGEKYLRFIHGAIILLGMLIAAGYAAFYLFKLTPGVVAGILMGVPLLIIARHSIRHN